MDNNDIVKEIFLKVYSDRLKEYILFDLPQEDQNKVDALSDALLSNQYINVWIAGKMGTGKTTTAVKLLMSMFTKQNQDTLNALDGMDEIKRELTINELRHKLIDNFEYFNMSELFFELSYYKYDRYEELPIGKIIVMDDLGWAERNANDNPLYLELFNMWIEKRYANRSINIVTTNFQADKLMRDIPAIARSIDRLSQVDRTFLIDLKGAKSLRSRLKEIQDNENGVEK